MKNQRTELGRVIITQVQRVPLKQGKGMDKVYDPSGLQEVPSIQMTTSGVIGQTDHGEAVMDAHHEQHPQSRFRGLNGISVGFTGHYDLMRAAYGSHILDGIAGENIIVAGEKAYTPEDLSGRLVFENQDGTTCVMRLNKAMAPCNEFSHFAHKAQERLAAEVLKSTLQDLDGGRRGFTLILDEAESGRIHAGARLFRETE